MGGAIERGRVMEFSYELALSELKFNLKSNVIPIGHITAGIHVHRALLFKVRSAVAGLSEHDSLTCEI